MAGKLEKGNGSMLAAGRIIGDPKGAMTARQKMKQAKKLIEKQFAAHPCGTCDACCTVKGVAEIEKPEFEACKHLVPREPDVNVRGGCSIYKTRPQSCKDYFCAYRYGIVGKQGEGMRPDVLGVVFDMVPAPPPGILMIAAREVTPGAFEAAMGKLNEVAARGIVIYLIVGDRRRFMGPEELVQKCVQWSRRHLPLIARD